MTCRHGNPEPCDRHRVPPCERCRVSDRVRARLATAKAGSAAVLLRAKSPAPTVRIGLPIIRPYRCIHFGKRIEFRPGCGGWGCIHDCVIGYRAVPSTTCQRCESYVEDVGEQWIG
jgi:hypothetical protein